jgi:hypothetical protein
MKSYIAVHEDKGIYLGIFAGLYLFSNSETAFSSKAIRFNTKEEIIDFFSTTKISNGIEIIPVETKETGYYVDVIDIIKSGYTKYTDTMIANIPMENETIH